MNNQANKKGGGKELRRRNGSLGSGKRKSGGGGCGGGGGWKLIKRRRVGNNDHHHSPMQFTGTPLQPVPLCNQAGTKVKELLWKWDAKGIKHWEGDPQPCSSPIDKTSTTRCLKQVEQEYDDYADEILQGIKDGWTVSYLAYRLEWIRTVKFHLPCHNQDVQGMKKDVSYAAAILATTRQELVEVSWKYLQCD